MTVRLSNQRISILRSQDRRTRSGGCLGAQEIERLEGVNAGDTIFCANGVLWVTQEGDPEDYLLKKGEKFVAERPGLVLIQGLKDCADWWLDRSLRR